MKWFSLLLLVPIALVFWVGLNPPDSTYHPLDPEREAEWLRGMGLTEEEIEEIVNLR